MRRVNVGSLHVACSSVLLVAPACSRVPLMDERIPEPGARVRAHLDAAIARSGTPGLQYVAVDASGVLLNYAGGPSSGRPRRPATGQSAGE